MSPILSELEKKLSSPSLDARRLFHGRGHTFEGLTHINIDYYSPALLITLYEEPEEEEFLRLQQDIIDKAQHREDLSCLVVQRRYLPKSPAEVVWGENPDTIPIREKGLNYLVRLGVAQNAGFFLDMANGREWLRENSQGKSVLNLFSYTCSLSVAAFDGGAKSVVNVDMSKNSLNLGRQNHQLNRIDPRAVEFLAHDIFKSWAKLRRKGPYDTIIFDPPFFQKGSFSTEKDYGKMIRRIPELMGKKGMVFATLNTPGKGCDFLLDLFQKECPECHFIKRLENPEDFPEQFEERGLKVLLFEYSASENKS